MINMLQAPQTQLCTWSLFFTAIRRTSKLLERGTPLSSSSAFEHGSVSDCQSLGLDQGCVFRRSYILSQSCCSVAPGATAVFLLLRKEPELCNMFCGTVVLFGKGSLQCQTESAYVLELAAVFSPETEGGDSDIKIDIKSVFLCLCLCSLFLFLCLLSKDRKYTTAAVTTHPLQWGKNLHQTDSPPRPRNPEGPSPPP